MPCLEKMLIVAWESTIRTPGFWQSCATNYRDPTKSRLSHSFRLPRLWTQHQEVMPKSCLLVFPHSKRKRYLKKNVSKSVTSEPVVSVISFPPCPGDSIFLLSLSMGIWSYSFERFPFLGRMILLLSPSLRCWYALRLCSGCFWVLLLVSYPSAWFYTCLPFVSHLSPICPSLSPSTLWVLRPHDSIHSSRVMAVV